MQETRDSCLIPGLGRSPGEGNGNLLKYFLAWRIPGQRSLATVHRVAKSWTWLKQHSTHRSIRFPKLTVSQFWYKPTTWVSFIWGHTVLPMWDFGFLPKGTKISMLMLILLAVLKCLIQELMPFASIHATVTS